MNKQTLFATAIILIATLFSSNKISAQWSQNATSIWNTTSTLNLGIGTNTPTKKLQVNGGDGLSLGWGSGVTGEGIGSKRSAGGNQWGVDFYTNTMARMSITNAGNVGIGTTTPNAKFQVNVASGIALAFGDGITGEGIGSKRTSGGNQYGLDFYTGNGGVNRMSITNAGNVGINTTNPTAKFEVNLVNTNGWNGNKKVARFLAPDNGYYLDLNTYVVANSNVGYQFSPNGNVGMCITTPGNIGIGTSSPTAKLQVNGGILRVDRSNGIEFGEYGSSGNGNQASKIWETGTNYDNKLIIQPGSIYFGEWSAIGRLEVNGYMNITTGSLNFGDASSLERIVSNRSGSTNLNGLDFYTGTVPTPRMSITNTGNVGIGTQSPLFPLDLLNGIIRCGAVLQGSDARYKANIQTLNGALGKILTMRGTSYEYNAEQQAKGFSSDKQVGFIAQELQKVIPELVKEDANGMLAVNYTGVIPVLVEALKEQNEVIEEKETRIAALEAQNAELQSRLARIEAALGIATDRQPAQTASVSANISPNPSNGLVIVGLTNIASAQSIIVKIIDGAGHEIANRSAAGESSIQFNLSQFPSGLYVAQVIADGKMVSSSKVQLIK